MKQLKFVLCVFLSLVFAQVKSQQVYNDGSTQVYFNASRSNATCDVNQCTFTVQGAFKNKQYATLTFRINYLDCNGHQLYKLVTILIGQDANGERETKTDWEGNNGGWFVKLDHTNL